MFFDDDYKALFERDKVFVEYVYKLLLQNKDAFDKAEGFRSYINKTVDTHFSGWRNEFAEFQAATSNTSEGIVSLMDADYDKVLTNVENKYLTINGLYFYHQQEGKEKEKIKNVSDFVIRASTTKYSRQKNEKGEEQIVYPPLVLVDGMNYSGDYMERNLTLEFKHQNPRLVSHQCAVSRLVQTAARQFAIHHLPVCNNR